MEQLREIIKQKIEKKYSDFGNVDLNFGDDGFCKILINEIERGEFDFNLFEEEIIRKIDYKIDEDINISSMSKKYSTERENVILKVLETNTNFKYYRLEFSELMNFIDVEKIPANEIHFGFVINHPKTLTDEMVFKLKNQILKGTLLQFDDISIDKNNWFVSVGNEIVDRSTFQTKNYITIKFIVDENDHESTKKNMGRFSEIREKQPYNSKTEIYTYSGNETEKS